MSWRGLRNVFSVAREKELLAFVPRSLQPVNLMLFKLKYHPTSDAYGLKAKA